jgi:hypothetical protein
LIRKTVLAASCLAALASFVPLHAFAGPSPKVSPPLPTGEIKQVGLLLSETFSALRNLNLNRAESACNGENRRPGSTANNACIQKYLTIYKNPVVDMRLVFGYKNTDASEYTADGVMMIMLIDMITSPCPNAASGIFACGFRRDKDNAEIFFKEVTNPRGENRLVKLTLASSSHTPIEELNQKDYKKAQQKQSMHAEKLFLDGLKHADVLLYGGGPSFFPSATGHSDKWSQIRKSAVKQIVTALRSSNGRAPSVIGLFSSQSKAHFFQELQSAAPHSGFIVPHGISWWPDEPSTIYGTLNGLLGQVCDPDFTKVMNSNPQIDPQSRLFTEGLF